MPRTDGVSEIRSIAVFLLTTLLAACANSEPAPERRRGTEPARPVEPEAPWREAAVPLPPYPREENLTAFLITGPSSFKYFADTESVRIDDDRVVRYSLVIRSGSGVENVSFEGIRCETREFKVYAIGTNDRTWLPLGNSEWKRIEKSGQNDYRYSLHHYYLCPIGYPHVNARKAVLALERGQPDLDYEDNRYR
jgi:hypothetical protein